jgi:putative DNA primase/helicase
VAIDANQQAPFWISPVVGDPDPIDILPAANGLLDLSVFRPTLMPHTPRFFSTSVLPYPYDPHAAPPDRWSKFLLDQWPDDPDSISTLDEVIGYLLTPDTRQHKMFFLIGPPRSGRSTIKEVITALIGAQNVAACSPQSLSGEFGLEPLIGKSLAIMADVRTGANTGDVLDRLLRISGGDPVEVNCKHKTILANVGMRTRFLVVSNEMPEFRDPSKAITTRYLVLRTSKSIQPDQRDPDLLNKLREELPGILNLAIEGRRRLRERGRFLQPASALHLIEQAEDLASPVAEFARECLVLNPAFLIPKQKAFECWKAWAEKNGHKVGSSSTFGKNLIAALSGSGLGEYRPRDGQRQVAHYTGIGFPDGGGRET